MSFIHPPQQSPIQYSFGQVPLSAHYFIETVTDIMTAPDLDIFHAATHSFLHI